MTDVQLNDRGTVTLTLPDEFGTGNGDDPFEIELSSSEALQLEIMLTEARWARKGYQTLDVGAMDVMIGDCLLFNGSPVKNVLLGTNSIVTLETESQLSVELPSYCEVSVARKID